jgi:hypothetical protein
VSGELWTTDLRNGRTQRLLPDFLMDTYHVSADQKRVVFIKPEGARRNPLWIGTTDGSVAPRLLVDQNCQRALFAPDGGVYFIGGEGGNQHLQRIEADGTALRKVAPERSAFLFDISPDGKWLAAWIWDSSAPKIIPADGRVDEILLCSDGSDLGDTQAVRWSRDRKELYLHSWKTHQTYVMSLNPGPLPLLPKSGISWVDAAPAVAGIRVVPHADVFMSGLPDVYAYPQVTTRRNIYRIPVP